MKQKNNGSLIFDILIATIIAGLAISVAIKMPVMLVNFWKKIQIKTKQIFLQTRVKDLFEKDFSTIFVPTKYLKKIVLKNNEKNNLALTNDAKKEITGPDEEKKGIENLFFLLKEKDNNLDFCFFVSTNLTPSFSKPKQKLAGIFYVLEKMARINASTNPTPNNQQNQDYFQLTRIESEYLSVPQDFSTEKIPKKDKLIVMKFIKKLTIVVTASIQKQTKNKTTEENQKTNDPSIFEIKTSNVWPLEENAQNSPPRKIKLTCNYFDEQLEEQSFEVETIIFSGFSIEADGKKNTTKTELPAKQENEQLLNKN